MMDRILILKTTRHAASNTGFFFNKIITRQIGAGFLVFYTVNSANEWFGVVTRWVAVVTDRDTKAF